MTSGPPELELAPQHALQRYEILKRFKFPWPVAKLPGSITSASATAA